MMEVYVVTADTYDEPYGSYICLFGVFDSSDKAKEFIETYNKNHEIKECFEVNVVELNKGVSIKESWGGVTNYINLGGYCE